MALIPHPTMPGLYGMRVFRQTRRPETCTCALRACPIAISSRWLAITTACDGSRTIPKAQTRFAAATEARAPSTTCIQTSGSLDRKEHPFLRPDVLRWFTMLIEPPIYLNAVLRDFLLAGGRIVVRDFPDLKAVLELAEPVIMNCTGLGAKALFSDQELIPIKGQYTVLLPQPEIDYITDLPGDMVPRKDASCWRGAPLNQEFGRSNPIRKRCSAP